MDLKIDPEFKNLIRPLTDEERFNLETNLKVNGCIEPIVVWNMTILDGHNRYEICTKHDIVFDIHSIDLPDRDAAMDWIDRNQIGRRNLSKDDYKLIVGRIYNRTKKAATGRGDRSFSGDQKEHPKSTAEVIAKDFDVSPVSVRRYGKFAEAVDGIQKEQPNLERERVIEAAKEQKKVKALKEKDVATKRHAHQPKTSWAMDYAEMAISQLERIDKNDPQRKEALKKVISWANAELKS